jgi:hypothetical protein
MQLIQAKITGQPRVVQTKHGERSVVDARAARGAPHNLAASQ